MKLSLPIAHWKTRLLSPTFTLWAWMGTAVVYALVKFFVIGKYNNFKIFRQSFFHVVEELPLYQPYPAEYNDLNLYGVLFSGVMAPFALLPPWLGMVLWITANTFFLYYAIGQLPLSTKQKSLIYWVALLELMTAQGVQQFNISVAALLILSFVWIEQRKEFWAAALIVAGTLIKIYPIAGCAFFFFSKHKIRFLFSLLFWGGVGFLLPMVWSSPEYVLEQYRAWAEVLQAKNGCNLLAVSQNISALGLVRKVGVLWGIPGAETYTDLWLIGPGLLLFFIPYLRIRQYRYLSFRLMLLANVLLFLVLFSSGSEASGYVLVMVGIALWYLATPNPNRKYAWIVLLFSVVVIGLSTTEVVPAVIRRNFITPYVVKAWCALYIWGSICYDMIFRNFALSDQRLYAENQPCERA